MHGTHKPSIFRDSNLLLGHRPLLGFHVNEKRSRNRNSGVANSTSAAWPKACGVRIQHVPNLQREAFRLWLRRFPWLLGFCSNESILEKGANQCFSKSGCREVVGSSLWLPAKTVPKVVHRFVKLTNWEEKIGHPEGGWGTIWWGHIGIYFYVPLKF